jgi:hypothetical protein
MKTKIKYYLFLFAILLGAFIYLNSNYYIKNQNWKYNKGYHIGDHINYKPENTFLCLGQLLIIKNPEKFEFGYYCKKKN